MNGLAPRDGENPPRGSTYIFGRSGDAWTHLSTILVGCPNTRMSGNGSNIVGICRVAENEFYAITLRRAVPNGGSQWVEGGDWIRLATFNDDLAMALNENATRFAVLQGGREWSVDIYRSEAFTWIHEARLVAPAGLDRYNAFGVSLAFSRDGQKLAIGDYLSSAASSGVSPAGVAGNAQHGAVFVYERTVGDTYGWALRSVVKAPNPGVDTFGLSVALSGSGRTLAVGAMREDSSARGIDGNQFDESAEDAGAAYLY